MNTNVDYCIRSIRRALTSCLFAAAKVQHFPLRFPLTSSFWINLKYNSLNYIIYAFIYKNYLGDYPIGIVIPRD